MRKNDEARENLGKYFLKYRKRVQKNCQKQMSKKVYHNLDNVLIWNMGEETSKYRAFSIYLILDEELQQAKN